MQINPAIFAITSQLFLVILPVQPLSAGEDVFDPFTGFRIARYRAPVPDPPPGIKAVDTASVARLTETQAVLVDVRPLGVYQIAEDGNWIVPERIESLPGAIWLPVVGWGEIEPWANDYLVETLAQIATDAPVVIVFCRIDCWLSWNAAQRVAALGYDTKWYPGGIEDWHESGRSLVSVAPWPLQKHRVDDTLIRED